MLEQPYSQQVPNGKNFVGLVNQQATRFTGESSEAIRRNLLFEDKIWSNPPRKQADKVARKQLVRIAVIRKNTVAYSHDSCWKTLKTLSPIEGTAKRILQWKISMCKLVQKILRGLQDVLSVMVVFQSGTIIGQRLELNLNAR